MLFSEIAMLFAKYLLTFLCPHFVCAILTLAYGGGHKGIGRVAWGGWGC